MAHSSPVAASRVRDTARNVARKLMLEHLEGRRYFADINVTTNQDTVNATDGVTSLREAVTLANTLPGADTLVLKSGLTYTLNQANGRPYTLDGRQGYASQLTLTGDLTIKTDDTAGTTITGNGNGRLFTAGDALGTAATVKFDGGAHGLTLTGGVADQGGALLVQRGASVSTYNVNFTNNKAVGLSPLSSILPNTLATGNGPTPAYGGSIFVNGGSLAMDTSSVSGSSATATASNLTGNGAAYFPAGDAAGGGIAVGSGSLTLTNTLIRGNLATGGANAFGVANGGSGSGYYGGGTAEGGGVAVISGSATFSGGQFLNNKAKIGVTGHGNLRAFGGGLYLDPSASPAKITGGSFQGNVVDGATAANGDVRTATDAYGRTSRVGNDGATVYGGAIASYAGLTLSGVDFLSNGANAGRGGEATIIDDANKSIYPGNNGDASGGAVFAAGPLSVTGGSFVRNGVIGSAVDTLNEAPQGRGRDTKGGNAGTVRGGAIYAPGFASAAKITNVLFDTNIALAAAGGIGRVTDADGYFPGYDGVDSQLGVDGGTGGSAFGGAVTSDSDEGLIVTGSTFRSNVASGGRGGDGSRGMWAYDNGGTGGIGGHGGTGGNAGGGAISYGGAGTLTVTGSKLLKNLVGAGDGGNGGYAGRGGTADSGGSYGGSGGMGGSGGDGGIGNGGAIYTASSGSQVIIATSAIAGNDVRGGFGGLGGIGGAGLPGSEPRVNDHVYDTAGGNGGNGGYGGLGGYAYGGGVSASGALSLRSSTVSTNTVTGGNGGSGGLGGYGATSPTKKDGDGGLGGIARAAADGYGGGVYGRGATSVLSSTVVHNTVFGGAGGNGGSGGAAPGGKVNYKPTGTGGSVSGGGIGGQVAIGTALLATSGIYAAIIGGTVTYAASTSVGVVFGGAVVTGASISLAAAGTGALAGLAGGLVVAPVAISGAVLVGTYGVFGIISSIAAIQALVGGGDAGAAFASTFADLNRYGSPADNADGPNAAKLFNFNSTANRERGYSGTAGADGPDADGHGGGVYTLSGATVRNSIVAANDANRSFLTDKDPGSIFDPIIVYNDDGFPSQPIPVYTNAIPVTDQADLTTNNGGIVSNGHNQFGIAPKTENGYASPSAGDNVGIVSVDSTTVLPSGLTLVTVAGNTVNDPISPAAYDSTFTTLPVAYTTYTAVDAGENLAVTPTDQLGNARNQNGTEDIGAVENRPYVPAKVSSVWVSSSSWSQAFKDQLYKQGLATSTGYVIVNPSKPLPWTNIDQIQVNFDQNVTLTAGSLAEAGLTGYSVISFTDFGGTTSGRFTLNKPLTGSFSLAFDPRTILGPGLSLDPSVFYGKTIAAAAIKPGDATGDGKVAADDVSKIRLAVGSSTTVRSTVYSVWYDLDGDGKIAANDLTLAQARVS